MYPETPTDTADYLRLLERRLVRPSRLEIWVANAEGSEARQVTRLGGANFAPFFHPDGKRIIFASNQPDPRSRNFDLYLVNLDGTGLERVTTSTEFDGFPMFSPDGKRLVFASNRRAAQQGETNIFVAEWVE
jgi:Tol biopolymer transport system component